MPATIGLLGDRVRHAVFLACTVPEDGTSAVDTLPADIQALVTASGDKIEKGFNPFTGPVTDNTGAVKIPAGESWGGDKMGNFDWYAEGVIGKAK